MNDEDSDPEDVCPPEGWVEFASVHNTPEGFIATRTTRISVKIVAKWERSRKTRTGSGAKFLEGE